MYFFGADTSCEQLLFQKKNFIQVFRSAFCDSLNQLHNVFSSKVVISTNYRKSYSEIQRPIIRTWKLYGHNFFELFDFNKEFSK